MDNTVRRYRTSSTDLSEGIVTEINRLGLLQTLLAAPGLAPEPLLGQRLDGDLVDHVVGQVLVQVGQTVGVLAQCLVLSSQSVSCTDIQGKTRQFSSESQMLLPALCLYGIE